ncbi:hypothetical protein Btru_050935 [Bulinus truncatus]|nr:hypothetical protein Btru_050935 [Bulinus truncatus]
MGLLAEGTALSWEETKSYKEHVKRQGLKQFVSLYRKNIARENDPLYWGDEVEYVMVKFDHEKKRVHLVLKAQEVIERLSSAEGSGATCWHQEFTEYQVESIPPAPYGGCLSYCNTVEACMSKRRKAIQTQLSDDEAVLSLSVFPRVGCESFTWPVVTPDPDNNITRSRYFPVQAYNQGNSRYRVLSQNLLLRRAEKISINVPVYRDVHTKSPFVEDLPVSDNDDGTSGVSTAKPDHIYMDCTGFGGGSCCLQVTIQASNIEEAKILYDHLAVLSPIMLALSASSPVYRGYLSDYDVRWPVMTESFDDRTKDERGLEPLKEGSLLIEKSRYDTVSNYISPYGYPHNDINSSFHPHMLKELLREGVDQQLAKHVAHLFVRDPLLLLAEQINQHEENETTHFDNIQTSNWNSVRFKPPPINSDMGWRVEFRPMEVQLTDFENAAFAVFVVLLTRVILSYNLNFIIPISKVDENMKTAYKRDSVLNSRFYFCKDVFADCVEKQKSSNKDVMTSLELMTMSEIFHGKDDFPGLIPLITSYMDNNEINVDTRCTLSQYMRLISLRASGHLQTTAKWIRNFVSAHPDYKQDSVVSETINYDLLRCITQISQGETFDPKHLLPFKSKSSCLSDNLCFFPLKNCQKKKQ